MEEQFVVNERRGCLSGAACTIFSIFFQILRSTHTSIFSSQNLYLIGGFRKLTISIACLSTETVSMITTAQILEREACQEEAEH